MNTERLNNKQKSNIKSGWFGFKTCLRAFLICRVFTRNDSYTENKYMQEAFVFD